ncbi:hypothetical protein ACF3NG_01880 [Aerococcaceae bacterium WGS1372]
MYVWKDNLTMSEKLLELIKTNTQNYPLSSIEAISRVIISKSYYACYNKIVELNDLYGLGKSNPGEGSHINTIDRVQLYDSEKGFSPNVRTEITRNMRYLKENRTKADYELGSSYLYNIKSVEKHLAKAKDIFELLEHPKNTN